MVKYTSSNAYVTKVVLIRTHLEVATSAPALHGRNCSIHTENKSSNKGLHRTAHKLPNLRGLAMIQPVEATHYFACALSGEP